MKCKICGNSNYNKIYRIKEMMFGLNQTFEYFECSECGCLQICEIPLDISRHYPEHYYALLNSQLCSDQTFKQKFVRFFRRRRDMYALLKTGYPGKLIYAIIPNPTTSLIHHIGKIQIHRDSRILDVGCGTGVNLCLLKDCGFRNLIGIDPYIKEPLCEGEELRIMKGTINELKNEEFDLIILSHSLEHMPDQLSTFKTIAKIMSIDATCLIRIPTVSSYAWKMYGVNWVQLDAPRHFYIHSINSLKLSAKKAGLQIYDMFFSSSDFQFWGSIQYIHGIPLESDTSYLKNPKKSLFSRSDINRFKKKARYVNSLQIGDEATFYLSKSGNQ